MCSKWGNNAKRFCDEGAVKPMVEYLGSHDIIVQRSAMRALEQLGKSPESCITMHRSGVVKVTVSTLLSLIIAVVPQLYPFFVFFTAVVGNDWLGRCWITGGCSRMPIKHATAGNG